MSLHQNAKGEWSVRWRQGNVNKSKLIGTKADAKAYEAEIKRRKRMGGMLDVGEQPFAEFVPEFWRGHHSTISETTKETRTAYIEQRILPRFSGYRLCDITPPVVREWQIEMTEAGVGAATQTKLLSILSMIFTEAEVQGKVATGANPVAPIKRPTQKPAHRPDPFGPERVEEIRRAFLAEGDLAAATFTSVAAYAGARPPHEILALTRADVRPAGLVLRPHKGNATEPRSVRLLAPLRDDLEAYQGVDVGRLFDWTKGHYRTYRERLQKDFGLPRVYDLRHAFVTLLLQEGQGIPTIADQLGHSVDTCLATYTHLKHLREERIDAEDAIRAARTQVFGSQNVRGAVG